MAHFLQTVITIGWDMPGGCSIRRVLPIEAILPVPLSVIRVVWWAVSAQALRGYADPQGLCVCR